LWETNRQFSDMVEVGRQPFVVCVEEGSDGASHFSNTAVSSATFT
jgi:hypothetical protein